MVYHSVPILAAFLTPALFYGGAAAMGAPILIHLLARRRFKRIRWAAMEFLIDAERRNRRRIRMEEWILLALRCLAIFLIGMMVARPFVLPSGLAAAIGGMHRSERVFILDDSFSMGYESSEGSPFDRAKKAVRQILGSIRQESPDDTVTILRMSASANPIEASTFLDDSQTQELLDRLEALTPSQSTIQPPVVIKDVADLLSQNPDITHATVYILSDFQHHDWISSTSTSKAEQTGLLTPLTEWSKNDRGLRVLMIDVGEEEAANISISELELRQGQLVAGTASIIRATVENHSEKTIDHLELQISIGNQIQPSKALTDLSARQSATIDMEIELVRPGFDGVRIELPPDALMIDNVRYEAIDVVTAIRVVVVNGEPSADTYTDEVTFLSTALRPEGELFSGNEVVVVDETELTDFVLDDVHLVILANVYRISVPAVESLERFVRQGGGLLIFLGDQVDADLYNTVMYRNGEGLSPARLTEVIRARDSSHLILTDRLHPILQGFSKEGDPLGIGQIPFFTYFASEPFTGSDFDVSMPGITQQNAIGANENDRSIPDLRSSAPAQVIARFDDDDESSAIVERSFGQGRVMLITTTVDKEWNLWPDHPTYLPLMMELALHAARRGDDDLTHYVGEPIELTLDPATYQPDVIVRTPAYPNEREAIITATAADNGRGLQVNWEHTDAAGLYQFHYKKNTGEDLVRYMAVNIDPRESDLTAATEEELRRAVHPVPIEYFKGIDQLGGTKDEVRTELWRVCLLTAMLLLMGEQTLAWWWGRRR